MSISNVDIHNIYELRVTALCHQDDSDDRDELIKISDISGRMLLSLFPLMKKVMSVCDERFDRNNWFTIRSKIDGALSRQYKSPEEMYEEFDPSDIYNFSDYLPVSRYGIHSINEISYCLKPVIFNIEA